jgi:hypothetical protein
MTREDTRSQERQRHDEASERAGDALDPALRRAIEVLRTGVDDETPRAALRADAESVYWRACELLAREALARMAPAAAPPPGVFERVRARLRGELPELRGECRLAIWIVAVTSDELRRDTASLTTAAAERCQVVAAWDAGLRMLAEHAPRAADAREARAARLAALDPHETARALGLPAERVEQAVAALQAMPRAERAAPVHPSGEGMRARGEDGGGQA